MERKRLLEFYQAMNNLPEAEANLASAIAQYLLSDNNTSKGILESLEALQLELNYASSNNNMSVLFIQESRGKLADLSIAISSFYANEENPGRPLFLLNNLKVACTIRGLDEASELISAIEKHLKGGSSSRIPMLQALAILESLIEDPDQDRSVYDGIYAMMRGESVESVAMDEDSDPIHIERDEGYINPFMRRETASQSVLEQRILIVDDEKMVAATVGFILSDLDLPIDIVGDGAAALDRLNEHPYSLVISDIEMPNFDGFSLIGAMRNDLQFSDVPLVFMSNKEAYRELALELGATDFFLKGSIGGPELIEKISEILENAPFVPQRDD